MNWHKAIGGALVTLGGYGATLPFPWNIVIACTALAGLFVRGSQISEKAGKVARKIPGRKPPAPPVDEYQGTGSA